MKQQSFYSFISLHLHPNSDERVHLGLLMNDGVKVKFGYSKTRLKALSSLFPKEVPNLARQTLLALEEQLNAPSNDLQQVMQAGEWGEKAISYLSQYSQNLLAFGRPQEISLACNDENFARLYRKYLGEAILEAEPVKVVEFEKRVQQQFKANLQERTNLNVKLDAQKLNGLIYPMKVMSLGKNDSPFACEALDFTKKADALNYKIGSLLNLHNAFEESSYTRVAMFAVANEPKKANATNHQVYQNLKDSKLIEVVPEDEVEKVYEYAEEHDVRPWLGKE